jgi:hypothetical protein
MKTQDEINEIRHQDEEKLKTVQRKADEIVMIRADAIHKRAQKSKDRIQELIDKKHNIFDQPFSKSYTLELLKTALRKKNKEWFFDNVLVPHARDCQIHASGPLSEPAMRLNIGNPDKVWKMMYHLITDKDLEEAVATLPDIGMSIQEKEAAITAIDKEIEALQSQIETELKKV